MVTKELELTIPGELKSEPFFYYIIKNFNVIPNIMEASFSTDMGWTILTIKGKQNEINKLLSYFDEKGVEVTFR